MMEMTVVNNNCVKNKEKETYAIQNLFVHTNHLFYMYAFNFRSILLYFFLLFVVCSSISNIYIPRRRRFDVRVY